MKPIIKNRIATFKPQGFIDGVNAHAMISMSDTAPLKKMDIDIVLISLQKIIYIRFNICLVKM